MRVLQWINGVVWGIPALILILGVGVYLSMRTGFVQLRFLPKAFRLFLRRFSKEEESGGVSPFQALCTALAATVGTGNLAGVAGAIAIGGPGSIFWMWISGLLGMATKYAEAVLAVRYQLRGIDGSCSGGPMYIMERGLGEKWHNLALCYCVFGVIASFGVGNCTQINAVMTGIHQMTSSLNLPVTRQMDLVLGFMLGILVIVLLLGGAKSIGQVAEMLVPFAAGVYILLAFGVLILRFDRLPDALVQILTGAFSPKAVTGGVIGSAFTTLRIGVSRGVFTNEAGMGTASIAHGSAQVDHPAEQGMMGIMEVFLDTIVICTLTALVILVSGVPIPYGTDEGLALTVRAFSEVYGPWVSILITAETCCFAFATILGWGVYGARCAQYLFGEHVWQGYAIVQGVTVVLASVMNTQIVWIFADTMNGLMALPNLITLGLLTPEIVKITSSFRRVEAPISGL